MPKKLTPAEFIAAAQKAHGDRYNYSLVAYKNSSTPVRIVCPTHGEFTQVPRDHVHSTAGCPACSGNERITAASFLARATAVHGTRYDYTRAVVSTNTTPVTIICKEHGAFSQAPKLHLKGRGCPTCGGTRRLSQDEIVAKFKVAHGDRYDYSKVAYVNSSTPVTIVCHEHGEFEQLPAVHKIGHGCPQCAVVARKDIFRRDASDVASELTALRPGFAYDTSAYTNNKGFINVTCSRGHTFSQRAHDAKRFGCPACAGRYSKGESALREFIESLGVRTEKSRKVIPPKELDIWCPDHAIGFEFNGLYYHSEARLPGRWVHYEKTEAVHAAGGRLVHIWSDDWAHRRSAVESLIKAALGLLPKLGARECTIATVPTDTAKTFLNTYHVQGYTSAAYLGLWRDGVLVACMGFAPARSARGEPAPGVFELVRYAASHRVAGGGSKLLQAWVRSMRMDGTQWTSLVTYCDLAQFSGKLYTGMGFTLVKRSGPDYKIIKAGADRRLHKSNVQKAKLKVLLGDKYDDNKTEAQMCAENYIYRIWDSGKLKFELRNHTV